MMFDTNSNVVLLTDGAGAYTQISMASVNKVSVNRQAKEWTKPIEATLNAHTGEKRWTPASTNYSESQWQKKN